MTTSTQRKPDHDSSERICEEGFRSGYIALVGRPNVGKSTLLNQILGQKIAAQSPKPQTTRRNVLGILHGEGHQIVLLDTPGIHRPKKALGRYMAGQVAEALEQADALGYLVAAGKTSGPTEEDLFVIKRLRKLQKKVILVINKIDLLRDKAALLPLLEAYSAALGDLFHSAVPISAKKKSGFSHLVQEFAQVVPAGPKYYPEDQDTDQSERFIASELVREKIMLTMSDEVPYCTAVTVEQFEDERPKIVRIHATVHVERESQKGIMIGKGGANLKRIGTEGRKEIEQMLGCQVFLKLHVAVAPNWSSDKHSLSTLGFRAEHEL